MCGILAIATREGERPSASLAAAEAMRDLMAHRGPDGAGLLDLGHVILGHRRLAVVDLTPAGAQPMTTPDGRWSLVYNGEIYNDAELRAELSREGVRFVSASDAETVLHALARWGVHGLSRLRGMFALALADRASGTMLLARDPLGIKPLYWWRHARADGEVEIVAASEPRAILAHPHCRARPDLNTLSAYLTTIRVTLGERTLFDGVRTLEPGDTLALDLRAAGIPARRGTIAWPVPSHVPVRDAVEDSVRRHARADVPVGSLLSGGLDSTIVAGLARRHIPGLRTFASGVRTDAGDLEHAALAATALGTRHVEAPISREAFAQGWALLVRAAGVPLGTPNEVAIHALARAMRSHGIVVALSGEGADELFCGYDVPLRAASLWEATGGVRTSRDRGLFLLREAAWVPIEAKASILGAVAWRAIERDTALIAETERVCESVWREGDALGSHQRFIRRINLAGLLLRLDSSMMRASIEGRTPLADISLAALAESMPVAARLDLSRTPAQTKVPLRRGFTGLVPRPILDRPKASFPLPFVEWLADASPRLLRSRFAREVFIPEVVEAVAGDPRSHWRAGWPMMNLAAWGDEFWGG